MEFSGDGGWRAGMLGEGGERLFFFFSGGRGGAEHYYFLCIPIHSYVFGKKNWSPIHSYVFQFIRMSSPKRSLNPNSFVCLQIHSYIFQKKHCISIPSSVFQFIRMSSNSFVCLLGGDGGYVFQFIRMSSRRGWWVEGGDGGWRGGERLYLFIFSRGERGARNIIILCVFQCIRKSSNSFVCLRKKVETQFIRMSSNSLGGVAPPEPGLLFRGSFVCLPIHGIGWGYPPPNHYYYFAEIIIMNRFRFIIIISRK